MDSNESLTPGGKKFREWLKKRIAEDNTNIAPAAGTDMTNQPGNVMSPTDPKTIAQRKAVNDIATTLMKKNPKLKPGGTDQQVVANLAATDPQLAKADTTVQQDVSKFFIKDQ